MVNQQILENVAMTMAEYANWLNANIGPAKSITPPMSAVSLIRQYRVTFACLSLTVAISYNFNNNTARIAIYDGIRPGKGSIDFKKTHITTDLADLLNFYETATSEWQCAFLKS